MDIEKGYFWLSIIAICDVCKVDCWYLWKIFLQPFVDVSRERRLVNLFTLESSPDFFIFTDRCCNKIFPWAYFSVIFYITLMKHKFLLIAFISYSQNAVFAPKSIIMRNAPPNKETQRDASGQVVKWSSLPPIRVVESNAMVKWSLLHRRLLLGSFVSTRNLFACKIGRYCNFSPVRSVFNL